MADKTPLKLILTNGDPTAIGEFATGDTLAVTQGGTGATTASDARANLGVTIGNILPPGTLILGAWSSPPAGTLKANGAAVSVSAYPSLDAAIYCGDANNSGATWGYRCANADGSGRNTDGAYIVLPDYRGEFFRGFDDARGIDSERNLYVAQSDQNKTHDHSYTFSGFTYGSGYAGGATFQYSTGPLTTTASGGAEARPRNLASLVCIVY